ncbi:uncharacterized protein LOC110825842 isoform X2 [Carica papaya]|uniref:uncharacterized protein LOC110825842 isoform X2 n=1 Tax=Carica papaya TaxID=3649 RepID=UPI000B8C8D82|nr:uncharacterized protein LOC110825842 isoform X2 [Carica papaya]
MAAPSPPMILSHCKQHYHLSVDGDDKEEEIRKGELEADKDRMMREYRAQLDAERALKLAHGRNHSSKSTRRKDRRDKDLKKRSSKKRKFRRTTGKCLDTYIFLMKKKGKQGNNENFVFLI